MTDEVKKPRKKRAAKKTQAAKKPPPLIVSFRVMCGNTRHVIGVTPGGRLYMPGHTIKELERELKFREMGGQPCKCADILEDWRAGRFELEVPQAFMIERTAFNTAVTRAARRLQRKFSRRRKDPASVGQPVMDGFGDPEVQVAILVEGEMRRRHIPVERRHTTLKCLATPPPEKYQQDRHTITLSGPSQGFVTVRESHRNVFSVPTSRKSDPPIRQIADLLECQLLEHLLRENAARGRGGVVSDVTQRHDKVMARSAGTGVELWLSEQTGLTTVTIKFVDLTLQAAHRVLEIYEQVREPLARVKRASGGRKNMPHRQPRPPGP